jgi:rubrerythrin
MDFSLALASASQALTIVKQLREIEKGVSEGELKLKMADLYSKLAEVRIALADAQDELRSKDAEIAELQGKINEKKKLIEVDGYMYRQEDDKPKGVPYCPVCLAKDGTQIHPANLMNEHWQCPRCEARYSKLRKY